MKAFWKDWYEMVVKPQFKWIKKHKLGYALMVLFSMAGTWLYAAWYIWKK